ncbi:hypothetical protein Pla123a_08930 [Posidoniimonas polymericola]|uniref:PEP-CTERM protein-sorting domain-containing protein n=1 Tax=Posidoniimonas polymericola TaxID=2528002 RepID=A0A5C5YSX9_9BACT|nr:hypothetical protein [Posidoniimonas polymericola]TWT78104.1 hypothetical protein Pla123a_08930 [Posidoniimonas polymericola]
MTAANSPAATAGRRVVCFLMTVGAVLSVCGGSAAAFEILDTAGFEGYSPGPVVGQFGGLSTWTTVGGGGGSALVEDAVGIGGTRGLRVERGDRSDDWWAAPYSGFNFPTSRFVVVEWDMRVEDPGAAAGVEGPFIGVEVYDDSFYPQLLGSLGVDAATRDLLYHEPATGAFVETGVTADEQWRHYQIRLDYLHDQFAVLADGVLLADDPIAFVDGPSDTFGDADLAAYAAAADQASQRQTAAAFFDNLAVWEGSPGDYNLDGRVDAADYTEWRSSVGTANLFADGNGDGVVNQGDYDLWRASYGGSYHQPLAGPTSAPEPAAATLLLLGACGMVRRGATRRPRSEASC